MPEYALIKVRPETKKVTTRLAKKYELNILDFMHAMALYFDVTGVNPRDMQVLSPAEELKKFRDTIVSFLRKQETEFIKPTFGKMDSLIARFAQYLEEEAPKKGDIGEPKIIKHALVSPTEDPEPKEENIILKADDNRQISELIEKNRKLELKLKTTKEYFEKVLYAVEEKSTGLTKKPVIELPIGDINEYKTYIKKLDVY